jgi:hypothetical protein
MAIFPYLTKHTCPKCGVRLVRDPDRPERVVCAACWAVAKYHSDWDSIESLVGGLLAPQEIERLQIQFDLPQTEGSQPAANCDHVSN